MFRFTLGMCWCNVYSTLKSRKNRNKYQNFGTWFPYYNRNSHRSWTNENESKICNMQIQWIKTYEVFYIWKNGRRLFCCGLLIIFISFYECLYLPRKHFFLPFVHNCILHFVLNNILFPSCVMYIYFRNPHAPDHQIKTSIPYIDVQNKHLKPDISKFL